MIEKMQFLSITGPKDDMDRMIDQYLSKYEIHLENALMELSTAKDLKPFLAINPYKDALAKAQSLVTLLGTRLPDPDHSISTEQALAVIDRVSRELEPCQEAQASLETELSHLNDSLEKILPFQNLDFDIPTLLRFHSVKYRFGRITTSYIAKFEQYVYSNVSTLFYECHKDAEYVWGIYFTPATEAAEIDAIYKSMHFERFYLPDEYEGTADTAIQSLKEKIAIVTQTLEDNKKEQTAVLDRNAAALYSACRKLEALTKNFDVRKLAACTGSKDVYYILCGWMSVRDTKKFTEEIKSDKNLVCIVEDDESKRVSSPPTKLKNPKLFAPFEMFTQMYGLPAYHEIDPTIFLAITYSFIFGWMFGDVGQGLCLCIGGFLLYHFKGIRLAGIIGYAGIFSTIFGFLFGSVFGFEDILPALWLRPIEAMSTLPFIGRLNTVFVYAIGFGMLLIVGTMVLHIINAIREKDLQSLCFDTNGIAGLVFYGSLILVIVLFMNNLPLPAGILLVVLFGVPLLLIGFQEPITHKLLHVKEEHPTGPVMLVVQAFFELFEVLLSYFSNTLSFVRIGAFAVSHVAMMEVVMMLAGAEAGSPNLVVIILGNLFVCGLEGLIVGIQVLRLEYYEMFSRYYKGNGRVFQPYAREQ